MSSSVSLDDSVHVDGSYSCLRGEDDRRLFFHAGSAGVKSGVFEPFSVTGVAGLGERWGGGGGGASSSTVGSATSSAFAASRSGVEGWLDFLSLGIDGSSMDGVEDTLLCAWGRGGEPGGETGSSIDSSLPSDSSELSTSDVGIHTLKFLPRRFVDFRRGCFASSTSLASRLRIGLGSSANSIGSSRVICREGRCETGDDVTARESRFAFVRFSPGDAVPSERAASSTLLRGVRSGSSSGCLVRRTRPKGVCGSGGEMSLASRFLLAREPSPLGGVIGDTVRDCRRLSGVS